MNTLNQIVLHMEDPSTDGDIYIKSHLSAVKRRINSICDDVETRLYDWPTDNYDYGIYCRNEAQLRTI